MQRWRRARNAYCGCISTDPTAAHIDGEVARGSLLSGLEADGPEFRRRTGGLFEGAQSGSHRVMAAIPSSHTSRATGKLLRGSLRALTSGALTMAMLVCAPYLFLRRSFQKSFRRFQITLDQFCPIVAVNNPACVEVSVLRANDNVAAPYAGERPVPHAKRHDLIASRWVEGPLGATG